ncbi:hypothetical protein TUM19329_26080 [Legionella antarctica]|uniref:Uncharacterized protein n=1 Tax=Legionella antarctica TaxID=2708020 RepID=A0A6F8T7W6_9GAMM|nr:hypothetical protein [Legionella antarctica]BCA96247.1 hypothetical protein TUM19329_26080 [Legionella antarctica]
MSKSIEALDINDEKKITVPFIPGAIGEAVKIFKLSVKPVMERNTTAPKKQYAKK